MRAWAVGMIVAAGCLAPPAAPDPSVPDEPPDALARAAACLDRGDESAAVAYLAEHVRRHPDEVMTRAMLAELFYRLGRYSAARAEFDRVVADAQLVTGKPREHLVHCHTRLMQMAEAVDDGFDEHLHRGIALVLLAGQWEADPDRRDGAAAEAALGKAVKALRWAREERPTDPRVNLYLAEAYARLGLASADRAARTTAAGRAPFALTPAERTKLADRK